jgi:hypothetical protein
VSTITATLQADADGTLHLPVPEHLRHGKIKVVATLQSEKEALSEAGKKQEAGTPLGAFKELRRLGGIAQAIPDPVKWQREQRGERNLPGRD